MNSLAGILLNFTLRVAEKFLTLGISIFMAILSAFGRALVRVAGDTYQAWRLRRSQANWERSRQPLAPRRKWAARPYSGLAVPKPPPRRRKRVKAKERSVP